jgi:hypothetical protein
VIQPIARSRALRHPFLGTLRSAPETRRLGHGGRSWSSPGWKCVENARSLDTPWAPTTLRGRRLWGVPGKQGLPVARLPPIGNMA